MRKSSSAITRRDFLRGSAGLAVVGAAAAARAQEPEQVQPPVASDQQAEVVLVRDVEALDGDGNLNAAVLERMLDEAVNTLLGESDAAAAWKRLVKPEDTVGIKSNVWGPLRTPPALEQAIKTRVMAAGVSEERIGIDDRGVRGNPIFQRATALINVRPMRSHHWAGVGSLLKNYIPFAASPPSWHEDSCANLAGLWELPAVKGKTRLGILVMLTPLFHSKGAHDFAKQYTWPYKGLIVGTDPVAVDATGLRIIQAKRKAHFGEDIPLPISPKHIRVAEEKYHLGVADPKRIAVKRLGWSEEVLI
ncbi:MAG TPA: twin-arginine translocation signal domain-containing protein [Candidatus Hydrogenedentes bacterium]|nr:twin-arginine translocation signal domain-containing protein [Candidatus Hydrogenedentota bacterium]